MLKSAFVKISNTSRYMAHDVHFHFVIDFLVILDEEFVEVSQFTEFHQDKIW